MGIRDLQDQLDSKFSILIQHIPSGQNVSFSAFLDSFKDDYKQEWSPEEVYGRMDPVYFFKNTKRNINFSFNVPSENSLDAQTNFKKLSKLIRFNYPVYEKGTELKLEGSQTGNPVLVSGQQVTAADVTDKLKTPIATKTNNALLLSSPPLIGIRFANFISSPANNGKLIGKISGISFDLDKEATFYSVGQNLYPNVFKVIINFDVIHSVPLGWQKDTNGNVSLRDSTKFPYGV